MFAPPENCGPWTLATIRHYSLPRIFRASVFAFSVALFSSPMPLIEEEADGCIFQFGPNRLWIDRVPNLSHPDIWLELETNDTEAAASYLKINGVPRRDEVEQLREDFDGFWISDPAGVIHLVVGDEE